MAHEIARQRESADKSDKSDALQTLRARPSQRTTRQRLERVRFQRRFPMAVRDSMTRPAHTAIDKVVAHRVVREADRWEEPGS